MDTALFFHMLHRNANLRFKILNPSNHYTSKFQQEDQKLVLKGSESSSLPMLVKPSPLAAARQMLALSNQSQSLPCRDNEKKIIRKFFSVVVSEEGERLHPRSDLIISLQCLVWSVNWKFEGPLKWLKKTGPNTLPSTLIGCQVTHCLVWLHCFGRSW